MMAEELELKPIQVRKDISSTGIEGKPKVGFPINELIYAINHAIGWDNLNEGVIIGAGNLGKALSTYEGLSAYGLRISALFDVDSAKIGQKIGSFTIKSMTELEEYIHENRIAIAIITVPAKAAQGVADTLADFGIKGIWNFAPKDLKVPSSVVLQRIDIGTSFAVLSAKLRALRDGSTIEQ